MHHHRGSNFWWTSSHWLCLQDFVQESVLTRGVRTFMVWVKVWLQKQGKVNHILLLDDFFSSFCILNFFPTGPCMLPFFCQLECILVLHCINMDGLCVSQLNCSKIFCQSKCQTFFPRCSCDKSLTDWFNGAFKTTAEYHHRRAGHQAADF